MPLTVVEGSLKGSANFEFQIPRHFENSFCEQLYLKAVPLSNTDIVEKVT